MDARSLRNDRPSGLVGGNAATDSFAGRSLLSDRPSGLVGCYVGTNSFAGRSLRSDRPSGLVGRYMLIDRITVALESQLKALYLVSRLKAKLMGQGNRFRVIDFRLKMLNTVN
ncbi:hypothetical protein DY000_02006315 [Brassica cretica]|uniref:Uncharacterized protein n=1 Tax=Brassica cretica TaxID=69181 RepID=A0ABQ7CG91_BRACR|nr:hypothetical protein DY000_02006315 [Brassica cretica]